jgi:hypothetical protein
MCERVAPQYAERHADLPNGVEEIVSGSGGRIRVPLGRTIAYSKIRSDETFGVLIRTLAKRSYPWEFISKEGGAIRDAGSGTCH